MESRRGKSSVGNRNYHATALFFKIVVNWINNRIIVVPIDMSDFSLKALDTAKELVVDAEQIRVLHVLPTLEPAEPGIVWTSMDDGSRTQNSRSAVSAFLQEHGYGKLNITVRIGDSGTQIALFAEDIGAGLIVMPSHSRGMLSRMLLGSTTDRVVHQACCPVLVLKERKNREKQTSEKKS